MRAIASITATILFLTALCLTVPETASARPLTHTVRPGENLYRISLRYGVTVEAIARANGLTDPERIRAGQILTIPRTTSQKATAARTRVTAKALTAAGTHIVQRGDTLHRIARRYRITVGMLKTVNGLRSDRILPGQLLRIQQSAPGIGSELLTPQPLRIRRGPQSYFTTLALVAADTPLQILGEYNGWLQIQLPDGDIGWVEKADLRVRPEQGSTSPASIRGGDIAREAVRYLGTPYRWGGETSQGVDCSGFVFIVFNNRVPGLGRLRSYDYFQRGSVVNRADLLPGDLVFFTTYAPGPSHVGIYLGDGKFIHAASGAGRVMMNSLDDSYYVTRYLGARRLVNP
jgi:cell wall-associated NlpC family hydrolase